MDLAPGEAGIPINSVYLGRSPRIVGQQAFGSHIPSSEIGLGYRTEIPPADPVKIHGCAPWCHDGDQPTVGDSYQVLGGIKKLFGAISRSGERQPEIKPNTSKPSESRTAEASIKTSAGFETLKIQAETTFKLAEKRKHGKDNLAAKLDELDKARNKLAVVLPNKGKSASTVLNKTYYDQLRCPPNQLEPLNTSLFVMGFSFVDKHIHSLITRAARANPTLRVIIFCYPRDTTVTITDCLGYLPGEYPNIELVVGPRFGQVLGTEAKDHQRLDICMITGILRKASA